MAHAKTPTQKDRDRVRVIKRSSQKDKAETWREGPRQKTHSASVGVTEVGKDKRRKN